MLEIVMSGGWIMLPILIASMVAMAIIGERWVSLRPTTIAPSALLEQVTSCLQRQQMDSRRLRELRLSSPLGRIFAATIVNYHQGSDVARERAEESASYEVHELERYMDVLANIATVTPLMGLLGTVIGMIKVFSEIMLSGSGQSSLLAGGISEALVTTAAGLMVAIPVLICHRYLQRRIDDAVIEMERSSQRLLDVLADVDISEIWHKNSRPLVATS